MTEKSPSAPQEDQVIKVEPMAVDNPMVVEAEALDKNTVRSSSFTASVIEAVLSPAKAVHITQKLSKLEGATCGACQVANTYVARENDANGEIIFTAQEDSECMERYCCSPCHSFMIHVKDPQDEDMFTLERPGCCQGKPFLCCIPLCDACTSEITVHKGRVEGKPGKIENPKEIFTAKETRGCEGDLCHPQVKVYAPAQSKAEMTLTGPQCFGGCKDICCETKFEAAGQDFTQIKGNVSKMTAKSCGELCQQIFLAKDTYKIEYEAGASPKEKAEMLVGALLIDYMYFERDKGPCACDKGICTINCCSCYCMGCLCPCVAVIPLGKGGE